MNVAKYHNPEDTYGIDVVVGEKDPIVLSATAAFGSGDMSALPDIIQVEDYTAPSWLANYSEYFYPVENVGAKASDYAPIKAQYASYNGTLYGVPFDASPSGVFIKIKDLLQAGIIVDDTENPTYTKVTSDDTTYRAYHTSANAETAPAGIDPTADVIDPNAVATALDNAEQTLGKTEENQITLSDLKEGNWTWWDYINIGRKYSKYAKDNNLNTYWWGVRSGDIGTYRQMIMSGGAWYEVYDDASGKWVSGLTTGEGTDEDPYVGNPVALEALNVYKCMFQLTETTDYSTESASYNAFNGVTMTSCTASWSQPSVLKQADQEDNWTIVQMPHMTTGTKGNYSSLGGSAFYVINRGDEDRARTAAEWLVSSFGDISEGSVGYDIANQLVLAGDQTNVETTGAGALLSVNGASDLPNYNNPESFYYDDMKSGAVMTEWNEALKDPVDYGPYTYSCEDNAKTLVYNFCTSAAGTSSNATEILSQITDNFNQLVFIAQ